MYSLRRSAVAAIAVTAAGAAAGPVPDARAAVDDCAGRGPERANGRIVFTRGLRDSSLASVTPAGRRLRRLTSPGGGFEDDNPAVSPDGRQVAFMRMGSEGVPVGMVLDLASRQARTVLDLDTAPGPGTGNWERLTGAFAPVWTADGQALAFMVQIHDRPGEPRVGLRLTRVDGSQSHLIGAADGNTLIAPSLSPNGRCLLGFRSDRGGIGIMPVAGGEIEPVVTPPNTGAAWWSRDGREIITGNAPMRVNQPTRLYSAAPDGSHRRQILKIRNVTRRTGNANPAWMELSPDRRFVAYTQLAKGGFRKDLIIRRLAGGSVRRVRNVEIGTPSWGSRP